MFMMILSIYFSVILQLLSLFPPFDNKILAMEAEGFTKAHCSIAQPGVGLQLV